MRRDITVTFVGIAVLLLLASPLAAQELSNELQSEDFEQLNATRSNNVVVNDGKLKLEYIDPTIFEGFEDEDLSEYVGDKGSFSFDKGTANYDGVSLRTDSDSGWEVITSTSELNDYPSRGDDFYWYHRGSKEISNRIYFAWNGSSGYAVEILGSSNDTNPSTARLLRIDSDNVTVLDVTSFESGNTWRKYDVSFGDTITIHLRSRHGNASLSATDRTYDTGGIGIGSNEEGVNYANRWDNFTIEGEPKESGFYEYNYSTAENVEDAKLNWTDNQSGGNISYFLRSNGNSYIEVTENEWEDLPNGANVSVRIELKSTNSTPSVDRYILEYVTNSSVGEGGEADSGNSEKDEQANSVDNDGGLVGGSSCNGFRIYRMCITKYIQLVGGTGAFVTLTLSYLFLANRRS